MVNSNTQSDYGTNDKQKERQGQSGLSKDNKKQIGQGSQGTKSGNTTNTRDVVSNNERR